MLDGGNTRFLQRRYQLALSLKEPRDKLIWMQPLRRPGFVRGGLAQRSSQSAPLSKSSAGDLR